MLINGRMTLRRDVRFNEELRGPEAMGARTPAAEINGAAGRAPDARGPHLRVESDELYDDGIDTDADGGTLRHLATQSSVRASTCVSPAVEVAVNAARRLCAQPSQNRGS